MLSYAFFSMLDDFVCGDEQTKQSGVKGVWEREDGWEKGQVYVDFEFQQISTSECPSSSRTFRLLAPEGSGNMHFFVANS